MTVSVLFSEPKIPQSVKPVRWVTQNATVSVLFSEPKIPQCDARTTSLDIAQCFSALQRAENSSIKSIIPTSAYNPRFQCSSASRKFLNWARAPLSEWLVVTVSVLFSEPKIPQCAKLCLLE